MIINILAIDTDVAMAEWLQTILDDRCFRIKSVNLTVDGIQTLQHYEPDIIILSLMSPGLQEIKLCKHIRRFSNTPILILSALNKPNIVAELLDKGADDYLCKPVNNSVLIAHIRTLVRRTRFGPRYQFMGERYLGDETVEFSPP